MFDYIRGEIYHNAGKWIIESIIKPGDNILFVGDNKYTTYVISFLTGMGFKKEKFFIISRIEDVGKKEKYNAVLYSSLSDRNCIQSLRRMLGGVRFFCFINHKKLQYRIGHQWRVHFPNIYNMAFSSFGYLAYSLSHKVETNLVKENDRLHNLHYGKRCFIIGNGPSIGTLPVADFQEEYTFSVNEFMNLKDWEKLSANYWVCIDKNLLGLGGDENIQILHEIPKLINKGMDVFVPVEARYFLGNLGLDNNSHVHYLLDKLQYINLDFNMKLADIDLSRFSMQAYNVVIAAINIAVYMGFSEIYLLGCEQSVLYEELGIYFGAAFHESFHGYDDQNSLFHAFAGQRLKKKGIYYEIKTQLTQLMQYGILNEYCKRNGISLLNLTPLSLIPCIARGKLEEVI